jgi:sigma-B regulation protein RsbU (phosphoserine phosphatase)
MSKRTTSQREKPISASLFGHHAWLRVRRGRRHTPDAAVAAALAEQQHLVEQQQRRAAELEQDLQMARDIQQGLLLEAAPRLPGWELAAISIPARDLGGDLYDFLSLGGSVQGIMIGDVSGKGLPAALRMAVARTVFRHEARRDDLPGPTLAGVNRGILSEIPQGMVTMLYLRLDTAQGALRIANAGHTFPLFVNGSVNELELSGLPLGVDADSDYREATASLAPGDTVILYTDGVLEAESAEGEIFSYERLHALVSANLTLRPRAMMARLLHELRSWSAGSQSDDVTIVILRRRLTSLAAELCALADEVLGAERAAFWEEVAPASTDDAEVWITLMPELLKQAQARFGRGLARELTQQLRLTIEDYR